MAKFKFNWGWAMLLVFLTFMTVFLYLFYVSIQYSKDYDLVVDDYYTAELQYGEELKKIHAADTMRVPVQIVQSDKGVEVRFPSYIDRKAIEGTVTLFKPDNKQLDKTFDLVLDTAYTHFIPRDSFVYGRWNIILNWKIDTVEYLKEEKMYIN